MKDKKIYQFENLFNGEIHCYFDDGEKKKTWYKNTKKWKVYEHDVDWLRKKLQEILANMGDDEYLKVTRIFMHSKNSVLKTKKDVLSWRIPEDGEELKDILDIKVIAPLSLNIFDYYFDKSFYKKIQNHDKESLSESEKKKSEEFMERYIAHTKANILCRELSTSLKELFEGEKKISDDNTNISFIHSRFNLSQFQAIEKSLLMPTTIIKGPPGTGKTTTLLNIIFSAFLNGKTVLVSSKNNDAVDNILESIKKYNFDKFWFRFGNRQKLREEFDNTRLLKLNNEKVEVLDDQDIFNELKTLILANEKVEMIKESLIQWRSVKKHLENSLQEKNIIISCDEKLKIPTIKYKNLFINYLLWFTLKKRRKKAIVALNDLKNKLYNRKKAFPLITLDNFDEILATINDDLIRFKKYKKVLININELSKFKTDINFQEKWAGIKNNEKYYKNVICKIKNYINQGIKNRKKVISIINEKSQRENFNLKSSCNDLSFKNKFMKAFPVHFVTNLSIYKLPNIKYDYVILDEASQSDIQSTIGLLQKGKHNILCGDEAQLEPIYEMSKSEDYELAKKYNVDELFMAFDNSLLSIYSKFLSNERKSFLNEHYRCPPEVIKFSNVEFYNKKLKIMTEKGKKCGITLINVNGKVQQNKWINNDEIDAIVNDIKVKKIDHKKIAIISPFRDQVNTLKKHPYLQDIATDTIFKFQGREFDYVYFTTVLGSRMNHGGKQYLNKPSLINVAITRAKKEFILASDVDQIQKKDKKSLIGKLQSYILEKKYDIQTNTKEDVESAWTENIEYNNDIKPFTITPLYKKIKSISEQNDWEVSINARYADVFNIRDIQDPRFSKVINYIVFDKSGSVIFASTEKDVVLKNNDVFNTLELNENLVNDLEQKSLLTKQELSFMDMIAEIALKDELIMPTVKLDSIIKLDPKFNLSQWMLKSARAMHFDFVIFKKKDNKLIPIKVIELDDETHKNDNAKKRDKRKDWFASLAKIKIKRFISYKY